MSEEHDRVRLRTGLLRSSADAICARVRQLLEERGVPPHQSLLAQSFPDDAQFEFGVVVARDRRVFRFGFDYLHRSPGEGTFTEWEELTHVWSTSPWAKEVSAALEMLPSLDCARCPTRRCS